MFQEYEPKQQSSNKKEVKNAFITASVHRTHPVILLHLRPASLTIKNLQRRKIIHGMRPVGRKNRSIGTCVFVERSYSSNFCGSNYGCCLTMHISFSLCCALKIEGLYLNFRIL